MTSPGRERQHGKLCRSVIFVETKLKETPELREERHRLRWCRYNVIFPNGSLQIRSFRWSWSSAPLAQKWFALPGFPALGSRNIADRSGKSGGHNSVGVDGSGGEHTQGSLADLATAGLWGAIPLGLNRSRGPCVRFRCYRSLIRRNMAERFEYLSLNAASFCRKFPVLLACT